jgi:hypothetical protein
MRTRMIAGLALIAATATATSAGADTGGTSYATGEVSHRMSNRLGAFLAVGEPDPGILGLNLAYNVTDFLRAQAGYSSISTSGLGVDASATTIGVGAKALVPGWNLSPAVGVHWATVSYTGNGLTVNGFNSSGSHVYTSFGIDYQAKGGFFGAMGYNYSLKSEIGGNGYVSLGWFFDLLG